jgi:acyl-CoA dehydrogenase
MRGALGRSIQIVGALERVLELTVEHCRSRYQFGKPIGAFQMVQNHLAIIARDVQVARAAVERAIEAADDGGDPEAAVAVAKIVTSRAAAQAAARAHQVHGAIGATSEYPLQLATRRLLAWRMEHGSDAWWSRRLGELCGASDSLWTFITAQDGHVTR